MGSLFRSEEMTSCQMFLQTETAYYCVSHLGELGLVQFKDINANTITFNRNFINEVKRCEDLERILRDCRAEIQKQGIHEVEPEENLTAPESRQLMDLETIFQTNEQDLIEISSNAIALKQTYLELIELKQILIKTKPFFEDQSVVNQSGEGIPEGHETITDHLQLKFVAGVISRERLIGFERMLWRASHGNIFLKQTEMDEAVEDPETGHRIHKIIFIIFFQGKHLKTRVEKICEGFHASLYPCPNTLKERESLVAKVKTDIEDTRQILNQTSEQQRRLLISLAKNAKTWRVQIGKMKAIYHTMNMFNHDVAKECLIAECWCATKNVSWVQQILKITTEESLGSAPSILNRIQTKEEPPTFNIVNKFTNGFQNIVDAYGVANYTEVNPTPFMIITFPFLFALMFGDVGHGCLLTFFAIWMIVTEKKWMTVKGESQIWNTVFAGRYIVLLMGIFSIYTGLLYNDIFSKSINIFGSYWTVPKYIHKLNSTTKFVMLDPNTAYVNYPYPLGIDPIWQDANNKILFLNSYKMKISVIFGVFQMLFGVILNLFNHIHFKNYVNIFCEFIPQMLWLTLIFGYLVFLIFYKWINFTAKNSYCSPSLLMAFINMFLYKYVSEPCYLAPIYRFQKPLQTAFLLVAMICVPWLAFSKPLVQLLLKRRSKDVNMVDENAAEEKTDQGFGDAVILQLISMIEFCLSTISHTASYLRLWALSLAHAELSEVLWKMVLAPCIRKDTFTGAIMLYVAFAFWACLTISVLLVMESLSAFLHTLRLHWVEYQSKFYNGGGYPFCPFHFKTILEKEDDLE